VSISCWWLKHQHSAVVQALIDPPNLQLTFRHCGYQLEGSGQREARSKRR
jgi:hypothetical protein